MEEGEEEEKYKFRILLIYSGVLFIMQTVFKEIPF